MLAAHSSYYIEGEIQIIGVMRTKKKRLSDINQFFICFQKLDEEIEMLRYEIKAFSVRRLFNGNDKWGLSGKALKLLETFAKDYLNIFRASLALS